MDFERVGEVCPNKIVSLEYLYKNIFFKDKRNFSNK